MSQLTLKLVDECQRTQSKSLHLVQCGLHEFPKALFDCTWLEELNLNHFNDPDPIWHLRISENSLSGFYADNQLRGLPVEIRQLSSLKILKLNQYREEGLNNESLFHLQHLDQLEALDLSYCQINRLDFLTGLHHLKVLHLSENHLKSLETMPALPNLEKLTLSWCGIEDLSGIERLPALTELDLSNNSIQDFTPLAQLPRLSRLNLQGHLHHKAQFAASMPTLKHLTLDYMGYDNDLGIEARTGSFHFLNGFNQLETLSLRSAGRLSVDFEGVQSLPHLRHLDLRDNSISNIDFLEAFPALEYVDLSDNNLIINTLDIPTTLLELKTLLLEECSLYELNFPATLPQLTRLDVSHNHLSEIDFILDLPNLENLKLSFNNIQSWSLLMEASQLPLRTLQINANPATDWIHLQKLHCLTSLELDTPSQEELEPEKSDQVKPSADFLQHFTQLASLIWYEAPPIDLSVLGHLPQLTYLQISEAHIQDWSFLSKLEHLQTLKLSRNKLTQLPDLARLTQLTELDLAINQLQDLNKLRRLPSLEKLDVAYNQITDLEPLSSLSKLTKLDLSRNQITNLSPLRPLTALTQLDLAGNLVEQLPPLTHLTQLERLNLDYNPLTDLQPLADLVATQVNNLGQHPTREILQLRLQLTAYPMAPLRPWINKGVLVKWGAYHQTDFTLAHRLINTCQATRSTELDLGRCGLGEFPPALFECTWLETLNLGDTRSQNQGNSNNFNQLPQEFKALTALKHLYLEGCLGLPPNEDLQHLPGDSLAVLDISSNAISQDQLWFLRNEMHQLTHLDVSHNKITTWLWFQLPESLQALDLRGNPVHIRSPHMEDIWVDGQHLSNLRTIHLTGDLVCSPQFIRELRQNPQIQVTGIDWEPGEFVQ